MPSRSVQVLRAVSKVMVYYRVALQQAVKVPRSSRLVCVCLAVCLMGRRTVSSLLGRILTYMFSSLVNEFELERRHSRGSSSVMQTQTVRVEGCTCNYLCTEYQGGVSYSGGDDGLVPAPELKLPPAGCVSAGEFISWGRWGPDITPVWWQPGIGTKLGTSSYVWALRKQTGLVSDPRRGGNVSSSPSSSSSPCFFLAPPVYILACRGGMTFMLNDDWRWLSEPHAFRSHSTAELRPACDMGGILNGSPDGQL